MSLFENNIEPIYRYNRVLVNKLENYVFDENIEFQLFHSESQDVNLLYKGVTVHDSNNPQIEAINAFGNINSTSENSVTVIFGLGLGYLFKRAYIESKGKIVVYEPNLDILKFTFEVVDFSKELADERVYIANSRTELLKFLNQSYTYKSSLSLLFLESSYKLYPDELNSIKQDFPEIQRHLEGNFVCLFSNSLLWAEEGIRNIPEFIKNYSVDSLRNKFRGKAALVVSSGPSLDKNIESLKKIRNKVVLFCVSNAYNTLEKHKIKPDFVSFIDVLNCNKVVKDNDLSDVNLIIQSIAHNNTFNIKSNRKFVFYSNNDIVSRWLSEVADIPNLKDYENKGTVSYCALYSAYMMGFNPIIILGQDLAFTDGKCYSSASAYGDMLECIFDSELNKFRLKVTSIDQAFFYIGSKYDKQYEENPDRLLNSLPFKVVTVPGQNGEFMPTEVNYASFIKYFEEFAHEMSVSNLKLINSSIGGAQINGFENIELEKALENFPEFHININNEVENIINVSVNPIKENSEKIKQSLKELIEDIDKFNQKAIDGQIKSSQLLQELKRAKLNTQKIKSLISVLPKYYIEFKDNIISKHQILLNCVFKELTELTLVFEDEQNNQGGILELIQVAQTSLDFYEAYILKARKLKEAAQHVVKLI